MQTQPLQEQEVAVEIAAEATGEAIGLVAKMKAAPANLPYKQIFKLTLLGLALIAWWPVYLRLEAFSLWLTYEALHLAPGTHHCPASRKS